MSPAILMKRRKKIISVIAAIALLGLVFAAAI